MEHMKTKSLRAIEERMEGVDKGSLRYRILENAKQFKTSWIGLGQSLYAAWKEKMYRQWGYQTFEAYTAKEIGIRKPTALKLLKSYYFLEKEAPAYLSQERSNQARPATLPSYESVNLLRLAKDRQALDEKDYAHLKKDVLDHGKEPQEVRKGLTAFIKQREELDPEEAREKKRSATVRRLLSLLKAVRNDLEINKLVPAEVIRETSRLIRRIEEEL